MSVIVSLALLMVKSKKKVVNRMLPYSVLFLCVHKIAKNEGFSDYKIETKAGSSHVDNFLVIMTAIILSGNCRKNGPIQSEELHLLCKALATLFSTSV